MPRERKLPPGLVRRGSRFYVDVRCGIHGNRRRFRKSVGSDQDKAIRELAMWQAHFASGADKKLGNGFPLEDTKRRFLTEVKLRRRPKVAHDYASDLDRVLASLNGHLVSDVTAARIRRHCKKRLKDVCARTINKEVTTLQRMLNWAVDERIIGSNPVGGLPPLPHDVPRKDRRSLTVEECDALLNASLPRWRTIWRCFLTTGMRAGEVTSSRWEDIDWEQRTLTVRKAVAKSARERQIPIDDTLYADLKRLRRQAPEDQQYVFVTKLGTPLRNNVLRALYASCKRAGIETGKDEKGKGFSSVDLHSLRVTFATLAMQNGANPKDVQDILGHSTLDMTLRIYAKATDQGRRSAISALPFASASGPDHLIPVQISHKSVTDSESTSEAESQKGIG